MNPDRQRTGVPAHVRVQRRSRAFTLVELLVVMTIIVILAGITALSVRGIAQDAKISSSTNAVMSALDNTRAIAMKDNKLTALVFRPRSVSAQKQYTEMIICEWTGEIFAGTGSPIDRFLPIPDAPIRQLPQGIKVAGPSFTFYDGDEGGGRPPDVTDETWYTQANLATGANVSEWGTLIAVIYGADGTTRTYNMVSDSVTAIVDFNRDVMQTMSIAGAQQAPIDPEVSPLANTPKYFQEGDEPTFMACAYIAVYDDDDAREFAQLDWSVEVDYRTELSEYITSNANRIHFNRYTGVALK